MIVGFSIELPTGSKYITTHSLFSIIVRANSMSNSMDFELARSLSKHGRVLAKIN